MYGSFRFTPPEPRPDLLSRPRLLRSLVKRWEHRVTSVVGGPGLGKTTLLVQALAENRLAPRGEDIWIGIEPHDADADHLANIVATALSRDGGNATDLEAAHRRHTPEPTEIADAVWRRSPTHVCLVFDDVHRLPPGSAGAAWLDDLVTTLPTNGHIVLAGRSEPPVTLTHLSLHGAALHLDEDNLLFSNDELAGFAAQRGLDPNHFANTGGWPAMAELTATVDQRFAGRYLWDEILEPLGSECRHMLAVLTDLGEADDGLASAAIGVPVSLDGALEEVPLVARSTDGWHRPHGLWGNAPGLALTTQTRATIRRRAAVHLVQRGRFDEAFSLLQDAELWDDVPPVLRAACLQHDRLRASQLRRWLAVSPDSVRASAAGQLATGLHAASAKPGVADDPLKEAAARCRAEDDVEGELTAIARLGQLAWWRHDLETLAELFPRVTELESAGLPAARGLAAFGRALLADMAGDDDAVLAELDSIEPNSLDATWEALANWVRGVVYLFVGQPDETRKIVERLVPTADSTVRSVLEGLQVAAWWHLGRAQPALQKLPAVLEALERSGVTYNLQTGRLLAVIVFSQAGDVRSARRWLADASASPLPSDGVLSVYSATAEASLQLAEGDEERAAATVQAALDTHGFGHNLDRVGARHMIPLCYILIPETRAYVDGKTLRGSLRHIRDLAAMVVAVREDRNGSAARTFDLPDLDIVRTALHYRFAAELAVGLVSAGRPEGRVLLDVLGPAGRDAVRELPRSQPRLAKAARSLLATVPAPPPRSTYLAVLGPLVLRRDGPHGEEVTHSDLRRKRVQTLLAYLVGHRRTTRTAICAALWPDLDERSAANNLSVTLNHLLRLLEPQRATGEPAYLLRVDGQTVQLTTGDHLQIDLDDFDHHNSTAQTADAQGDPSTALDHYLSAIELYRDDLHLDLDDADWLTLDREHYRTRFVTTATRAGQLLLGRGDTNHAQTIAHRALTIDPWSEDAYTILVNSALARGDRTGAHRLFQRCLDALTDLGVTPSTTTRQLQHRLHI